MHYANKRHERRYRSVIRGKDYQSRTLAALYLLTFDYRLWYYWRPVFAEQQPIDWKAARTSDPDWDAYYLEQAARDIACHECRNLPLFELADRGSIPLKVLRLIVTALAIARCDPAEARATIVKKRRHAT